MTTAVIHLKNGRLIVSGDLDFTSVVRIWNESLPLLAECSALQFDLSDVTATKSAGLLLLLEWVKSARRENKSIQFNKIPPQLLAIAKVCGVDHLFKNASLT